LLDTPGILPNASLDPGTQLKLSLLNLVGDRTYDLEQVAEQGLQLLSQAYFDQISSYLGAGELVSLEGLAKKRKLIAAGGKLDKRRAAAVFLADLREGKLGSIILDQIPNL